MVKKKGKEKIKRKGKNKKEGGVTSGLAQPTCTKQPMCPLTLVALACVFISLLCCPLPQLCFDFRLNPSRSLPSRSASASTHLSLSLDGGRGTEEAGCCRPVPIRGRWPWPAGRSLPRPARLGGGQSATSPVSTGEFPSRSPAHCCEIFCAPALSLPLSCSLVWNLRRVVCYGVVCAAPWRLSDALKTLYKTT